MKKLFFIIGLFFSLSAMAQPTNYTKINMRYRWLSGMFDSALYVPRYNGTPSGVRINETSAIDGMIAMDTTNNRLYIYSGGSWIRLAAYSEVAGYTAGNGLTLSGSQFKLGGTLTEPTVINGDGTNLLKLDGYTSPNIGYLGIGTDFGYIRFGDGGAFSPTYENEINGGVSEIGLKTSGNIYLNAADIYTIGVPTVSSTTGRKLALIDTATGKVERIDPATLVTTPTLQQVLTEGSTLTTNNNINVSGNIFKFDNLQYLDLEFTPNTNSYFRFDPDFTNFYVWDNTNNVGAAYQDIVANPGEVFVQIGARNKADLFVGSNASHNAGYISLINVKNSSSEEQRIDMDSSGVIIKPFRGAVSIDTLISTTDTTTYKPMVWGNGGQVKYAANWYGAGGGASALDDLTDVTITSVQKGQTIFRDSVTSNYINGYDVDRRGNVMEYFEDFLYFTGTNAGVHYNARNSGANSFSTIGSWDYAETTTKRPGQWALVTGTTSTGYGMVDMLTNNAYLMRIRAGYYNGETEWRASFALHNESNATDEYVAYMGYMSSGISVEPTDGVYFKYDRANYGDTLVLVAANGGTRSQVTTNVLISSNAVDKWLSLRLVLNDDATSMRAYYKTETGNWTEITAVTGTYPIASNFPSGSNTIMVSQSIIRKTAGTATRVLLLDYIGLRQTIPKGR